MLQKIQTNKDGRLNSEIDVLVWDNEMQELKIIRKSGKLFLWKDLSARMWWFCVQDGNRHWTIYDVMSGYQVCWTTSLKKAMEMMRDPAFIRKVNMARTKRYEIYFYRHGQEKSSVLSEHFEKQWRHLWEEYGK